jgi:hypothetical protein
LAKQGLDPAEARRKAKLLADMGIDRALAVMRERWKVTGSD